MKLFSKNFSIFSPRQGHLPKSNLKGKFKFLYFKYPNKNIVLSEAIIDSFIDLFYLKIISKLIDKIILVQLVMYSDGNYRSLSSFINVNSESKKELKISFKRKNESFE